ncbi:MAG: hypothetical protein IJX17_07750 [Clostridia bacterium]|nr:hypothetical protein [Clostridia bacterium]
MKKSAKLTYIFHQVLMSLVLILNIISIFTNHDTQARSVYVFNITQAGLFLIITGVANKFVKKSSLEIPNWLYILLLLYASAHFLLGEIFNFYAKTTWWDSFLHTFSGALISFLSISLISILNDTTHKKDLHLNIFFICIFALSVSITIGVLWEFIEYASDTFFGTNMQRAYESTIDGNSKGLPFIGRAALADTMKDLLLDTVGSLITCILCAIFCKKKQIGLEQLSIIKIQGKRPASKSNDSKINILTNKNNENLVNEEIENSVKDEYTEEKIEENSNKNNDEITLQIVDDNSNN